jgi:3-deoxy-D-manno-octulosonic acid (KDO) 8-phosphate synthase
MGQYYKIVNVDKKQYLSPWTFHEGAKLMEFSCDSCGILT